MPAVVSQLLCARCGASFEGDPRRRYCDECGKAEKSDNRKLAYWKQMQLPKEKRTWKQLREKPVRPKRTWQRNISGLKQFRRSGNA